MVNIESFTRNNFIVIDIQILQVLIDKSMLDFLRCEKRLIFPIETFDNVAIFITFFIYSKNQLNVVG